jgi:hypothetical protein
MSMVEPTPGTVPADLVALEVEHHAETARVNQLRKSQPGACGYRAYLLGKQVANHPWLTAHPAGPQRRAARKALRAAAEKRRVAERATRL